MSSINQLDALRSMSVVVADTGDVEKVRQFQPQDCTTNPSLVYKALQMNEYKHMLATALEEEATATGEVGTARYYSGVADRLAVNIGAELLNIVPGRVSTEVDARLSHDTRASVEKARRLIQLYEARGINRSRVYIKMASTWEGIEACRLLEQEGINCNMTLLFSFAQAVACANAKAALISPFVGRILDWYQAKEGRQFAPHEDPGVLSVQRIYRYFKRYGVDTVVMAASFRSIGEIQELAGCDKITISPALLADLQAATGPLSRKLVPDDERVMACADVEMPNMDHALFDELHGADEMATFKLKEGIESFSKDQIALEAMLAATASSDKQ